MKIKIGCDLVYIKRFEKSVRKGGAKFLDKIFSNYEISKAASVESLAGLFAVKEAVIKALGFRAGDWKKIEIVKNKTGRPEIKLLKTDAEIISQDISISHDGDFAFAYAVFLIRD